MTVTTDTFTGSNGGAAPLPWVAVTFGGSQNIQSNKWQMNSGGSYVGTAMTRGATTYTAVDCTVSITIDSTGYEQYPGLGVRLGGGTNGWATYAEPNNGYVAWLSTLDDTFHLAEYTSGAAVQDMNGSFSISNGAVYKVRLQAISSTIRAKAWLASGSEPGTWTLELTDSTYTSGLVGFRDSAPSNLCIAIWDDFVLDDAPGGGGGTLGVAASDFALSATAVGSKTVYGSILNALTLSNTAVGTSPVRGGGAAVVAAMAGR